MYVSVCVCKINNINRQCGRDRLLMIHSCAMTIDLNTCDERAGKIITFDRCYCR